jgi:hypothetical protein
MYGVLLGGLALAWLVPPSWLLAMPVGLRLVAACVIAFLPIFAANVIFAKRFSGSSSATLALGTNLLGAMLGGCLEYLSLVTGYRALLLLAAVLYVLAYAVTPREPVATSGEPVLQRRPMRSDAAQPAPP